MTRYRNQSSGLSRRKLLKTTAGLGAGASLSGLLPSRPARAADQTLNMWWWGEQELPGLQAFVEDSVKNYKNATVKTMLQDTAVVISQFQTAAAAHKGPTSSISGTASITWKACGWVISGRLMGW